MTILLNTIKTDVVIYASNKGTGSDLIQKKFQSNQNIISIKYLILI